MNIAWRRAWRKTRQDKTRQDKTRQDKTKIDKTKIDKTRQDNKFILGFKKNMQNANSTHVRFLHNHGNGATKGSPKPALWPTLTERISCAQYHRQHCALQAFAMCTISMTNFRPGRDSSPETQSFEPQPDHMRYRGQKLDVFRKQSVYRTNIEHDLFTIAILIIDDTFIVIRFLHNQHDMLSQYWDNVGSPSATLVQH